MDAWLGRAVEVDYLVEDIVVPFRAWIVARSEDDATVLTLVFDPDVNDVALGAVEKRRLPRVWRGRDPQNVSAAKSWRLLQDSATNNVPVPGKKMTFSVEDDRRLCELGKRATCGWHWLYISCELGRFVVGRRPTWQHAYVRFHATLKSGVESREVAKGKTIATSCVTLEVVLQAIKVLPHSLGTAKQVLEQIDANGLRLWRNVPLGNGTYGKETLRTKAVRQILAKKRKYLNYVKEKGKRGLYGLTAAGRDLIDSDIHKSALNVHVKLASKRKRKVSKDGLNYVKAFRK